MKVMILVVLLGALMAGACRGPERYLVVPMSEFEPYDYYLQGQQPVVSEDGVVPDPETAVRIAEAVLEAAYEEDVLRHQRPLRIALRDDDVWIVFGTLPDDAAGGVAHVEISRSDGRVTAVSHGS